MRRRPALRVTVIFLATVASGAPASAAPHHHPHESALLACHDDVLDAARTLVGDVDGHLGRCLTHGLDCLVSAADPIGCCTRAAGRCDDDLARIHDSEAEFERRVSSRACTRLPLADLLDADGLGFAALAERCACLSPPAPAISLNGLATCLRRLVEDDAVARLALFEAPRTREALICLGLDTEFPAASEEQPSFCGTCPAATSSPTATPTVTGAVAATPSATTTPVPPPEPNPTATAVETSVSTPVQPSPTGTAVALPTASATAVPTLVATVTVTPSPTPVQPTPAATPVAVCGNGIVEGDEECDGAAIDDTSCLEDICTCDDFCDDAGGTLSCNPDCTLNFSACTAGGCEF